MALHRSGELEKRLRIADKHLEDCDLCSRYCHVNRKQTLYGSSTAPASWQWSTAPGHITARRTALRCVFCQNHDISWKGHGAS